MKGLLKFLLLVAVLLVIIVGVPLYGLYYLFYVGDQIEVHAAERFGERVCVFIPGAVLSTAIRIAEPGVSLSDDGRTWAAVPGRASLADATLSLYRDPRRGRGEVRFGPARARFVRLDARLPARERALEVGP